MQYRPHRSSCSIIFGEGVASAAPISAQGLYLVASDIVAVRDELIVRGIEVSELFHDAGGYSTMLAGKLASAARNHTDGVAARSQGRVGLSMEITGALRVSQQIRIVPI